MKSNRFLKFNSHPELYTPSGEQTHAFMSPSVGTWIDDDRTKFVNRYDNYNAKQRGTDIHEEAARLLNFMYRYPELGIKGIKGSGTFQMFVNESFKMGLQPEVPLRYSDICYGFADAVAYDLKNNLLRISDLKTGLVIPAKFRQLDIYAAILLLEYKQELEYVYDLDISKVIIEERIYQFDEVKINEPPFELIAQYMDKIMEEHDWLNEELNGRNE